MSKILFMMLFLLVLPVARAGINIEPYLGYMSGTSELTFYGIPFEMSYKTPMIGGRLGYGMMGLSLGVDYSQSVSSFEWEQEKPATTAVPDKMDYTNLGIYVGYKFPMMFRVWGTYFIKSEFEVATPHPGSNAGDKWTGAGYALGAGWTGFPLVALNLEYRMITFDEQTNASTGVVTKLPVAGILTKVENKEIMISLSLPLDF